MKKKWRNLLVRRCPQCSADLIPPDMMHLVRCSGCGFKMYLANYARVRKSMMSRLGSY